MADYDPVTFGCALRTYRTQLGWSANQLVALYAEFVGREDSPPNPAFIYHIEKGTTIVSQERRAILASLVGMPLALVGMVELDREPPLDEASYTQALALYCDKWHEGSLKQEAGAIEARTNQLETAVLQASGAEKRTLAELFGFYQLILASACGGQQPTIASALLSSVIEGAKEEKFKALLVYASLQRAEMTMSRFESILNCQYLRLAQRDLHLAREEQDSLPALSAGLLSVQRGRLSAYTARDRQAFTSALHFITKGSNQIGVGDADKRIIARLDEEFCLLVMASAYLYAPMGDSKLGLAVLQELDLEYPEACGKRRLVQRHHLFALGYLSTGDYPLAAAHLEAAVENAPEDYRENLVSVYTRLKHTSYGNDPNIGRLGVKVNLMRYPEFFP